MAIICGALILFYFFALFMDTKTKTETRLEEELRLNRLVAEEDLRMRRLSYNIELAKHGFNQAVNRTKKITEEFSSKWKD